MKQQLVILNNMEMKEKEFQELLNSSITTGNEGFFGDVFATIEEKIYKGLKAISSFFNTTDIVVDGVKEYATKSPDIKRLNNAMERLQKHIKRGEIDPARIGNMVVPVLIGLNKNMEKLVNILDNYKEEPSKLLYSLKEFINTMHELLETKVDDLDKVIPVKPKTFNKKDIENIKNSLSGIVDSKDMVDRMRLSKVFNKTSNLPTVGKQVIELGKYYSLEVLEELDELNDEASDVTKLFINNINNKQVNKQALARLSIYLKDHAEYITAVSFMTYVYYQVANMIASFIEVIENKKDVSPSIVNSLIGFKKDFLNKIDISN